MFFKPLKFILLFFFFACVVESCSKSDRDQDSDVSVAVDVVNAHHDLNNLFVLIDNVAKTEAGFYTKVQAPLPPCATLTMDTLTSPKSIKIEFDKKNGCVFRGKLYKGEINAKFYDNYNKLGGKISIYPYGLTIDSIAIKTTINILNKGKNSLGNTLYAVSINEGQLTKNNITSYYNCNLNYERNEGGATKTPNDDAYKISGSMYGSSSKGVKYTATISQELVIKYGCYYVQSGKLNIDVDKMVTRIVDFGTGCDNAAIISIAKKEFPITLR